MIILWICNILFPDASRYCGLKPTPMGGWMYSLAARLCECRDAQLCVASPFAGDKGGEFSSNHIRYFLLPRRLPLKYDSRLEAVWREVLDKVRPDIVHIHGTEYPFGLACMRAQPEMNYVISIQGLVSVYYYYYYGGLSAFEIFRHITLRDLLRADTLFQAKRKFAQRGRYEIEYIQRARHIIGRTSWDYAHTKAIHPQAMYHFCNEMLRDGFYRAAKWDIGKIRRHSVFLSQAGYPIKGAHQVIKAAGLLKNRFPDIQIRIAGHNITQSETISQKLRLSGYGKYLKNLIRSLDLQNQVEFLGPLDEQRMVQEYQNAHVFICPSSIENSPNSLGEAQMIGTPCVASYVGGVPDMVEHGRSGMLYRFEEVEMLAEWIAQIFSDDGLARRLSAGGIEAAEKRHQRDEIIRRMVEIYKTISVG